jgi:hypothetical protein
MKLIRAMILVSFLTLLAGCSTTSVYVLNQAELIRVKKDQVITVKYDGWLLSQRAVDRVMNAKIKAVNLE